MGHIVLHIVASLSLTLKTKHVLRLHVPTIHNRIQRITRNVEIFWLEFTIGPPLYSLHKHIGFRILSRVSRVGVMLGVMLGLW